MQGLRNNGGAENEIGEVVHSDGLRRKPHQTPTEQCGRILLIPDEGFRDNIRVPTQLSGS